MNGIIRWFFSALLIMFIGFVVPGISVYSFWAALFLVIIISIINTFIKPLAEFISMPINFLTLGLFSFVVNALLFLLAGKLSPGIEIEGFWSALAGSVILAVFAPVINDLNKKE